MSRVHSIVFFLFGISDVGYSAIFEPFSSFPPGLQVDPGYGLAGGAAGLLVPAKKINAFFAYILIKNIFGKLQYIHPPCRFERQRLHELNVVPVVAHHPGQAARAQRVNLG